MEKETQKQRLLEALKHDDLSVREILVDLWINSPTKVVSDLRKDGHNIIDCTPKAHYKTYRYLRPETERFL